MGGVVFDVNWSHDGVMLAGGNNKSVVLFDIRNIQDTSAAGTGVRDLLRHFETISHAEDGA